MIESLSNFKIRLSNLPELKNNLLAWLIAKNPNLNTSNKENLYLDLVPYYSQYKESDIEPISEEKEDKQEENLGTDYRIKSIEISGVRGFPQNPTPFGVNFCIGEEPSSAVILGKNGVGKSSIFTALEMVFGHEIGEAKLRNIKDYDNYITHFNTLPQNCHFIANTNEGEFSFESPIPDSIVDALNPNSHFISDFDIYYNGQRNYQGSPMDSNSFHNLIASSLGLQDFLDFNLRIAELAKYQRRKESGNLNNAIKNKTEGETAITNWKQELEKKQQELKTLSETNIKPSNERPKRVISLATELQERNHSISFDLVRIQENINAFLKLYLEFSSFKIEGTSTNEIDFLIQGLQLLEKQTYDDCPFCKSSSKDISEIKTTIETKVSEFKKYSSLSKEIATLFSAITEQLGTVYSQLENIYKNLENERLILRDYPEFSEWLTKLNVFREFIYKYSSSDFFVLAIDYFEVYQPNRKQINELYDILKDNKSFIESLSSLNKLKEFSEERNQVLVSIKELESKKVKADSSIERKAVLDSEIKNLENQINVRTSQLKQTEKEISETQRSVDILNRIKKDASNYQPIVYFEINKIVKESFIPIEELITDVLNNFLDEEGISIEIDIDKKEDESGEIISETIYAKIKSPYGDISPNKYFNTFRYRLFCMMVSLSIALASRVRSKVNLPVVLDDVFYSSDFIKRASIEKFLEQMIKTFSKFSDLPLQLILFTHDELIFDSAMHAIRRMKLESNTIFAKLLAYTDAEPKQGYSELTYRVPSTLPKSIFA